VTANRATLFDPAIAQCEHIWPWKTTAVWLGTGFAYSSWECFAETQFANMRMGLAAHLEGVMNGTFLIALGAIWTMVSLPPRAKTIAFWLALYGSYFNWIVTTLRRCLAPQCCLRSQEQVTAVSRGRRLFVGIAFQTVGIAIIACSVLVLWGLRRKAIR
jgi:hydroxylaminobenzene mutase